MAAGAAAQPRRSRAPGLDGGRPRADRPRGGRGRSGGTRYTATTADAARAALVEALDRLVEVLVPHLDREVAEAMPVVAASITNREWDAVEQEYNIKPKTTRQLAMEGHWLLEGIDAEGYDVVVHKVPGRAPVRPGPWLRTRLPAPGRRAVDAR